MYEMPQCVLYGIVRLCEYIPYENAVTNEIRAALNRLEGDFNPLRMTKRFQSKSQK